MSISPVSAGICTDFNGACDQEVDFTGVAGSCSISAIAGQTWPFQNPSPIDFPLPGNTRIKLATGLSVGTQYNYSVSCCKSDSATHHVTIVVAMEHKRAS
ncbi:MAG: hypothetical protein WCA16_01585 [Candidatus Sulfotelmatobacter sp.]